MNQTRNTTRTVGILGGMGPAAGADFARLFVSACAEHMRVQGIAVSDQAFISQEIFEQLYQRQQLSAKGIVASKYLETAGTPVLFSKKYFADLLALKGDSGAKSILKTYPKDIETITFEKGEMDIDTEEDYKKLIERS